MCAELIMFELLQIIEYKGRTMDTCMYTCLNDRRYVCFQQ